jgi:hypothetical protein
MLTFFTNLLSNISHLEVIKLMNDLVSNALSLFGIVLAVISVIIAVITVVETSKTEAIEKAINLRAIKKMFSNLIVLGAALALVSLLAILGYLFNSSLFAWVSLLTFGGCIIDLVIIINSLRRIINIS